jgi:hypothetical protein
MIDIYTYIHATIRQYILKQNLVVYEVGIHLLTCDFSVAVKQPAANRNLHLSNHVAGEGHDTQKTDPRTR